MKKDKTGRKKLSRQLVIMVFVIQAITLLIIAAMVRKGSINIYLSAKNDIISSQLINVKERVENDTFLIPLSNNIDYWQNHYEEISRDYKDSENTLTPDEEEYFGNIALDIKAAEKSGSEAEKAKAYQKLDELSDEQKLKFYELQYYYFISSFRGNAEGFYGYEGTGCFANLKDGRYIDLVWVDESENIYEDSLYVFVQNALYDEIIKKFDVNSTADDKNDAIEYMYLNPSGKEGRSQLNYMGMTPIVEDGETVAVITMYYNFKSFSERINQAIITGLILVILANILVCILFIFITRRIAVKPISSIQDSVREYMTSKDGASARKKLKNINSKNEIGVLASDVDKMIGEIDDYIGEIEEAGQKLKNLTVGVTEALANAIDAKDKYTNGHSKRVAEYSKMIAEKAGKPEDECYKIYYAALLHDVGKIGVPGEILNMNRRLTDEEFSHIKQHPVVGNQILSSIKEHPWLSLGAHFHHERYDGKGYPEGLKGDEIPEIGRIIAVADAYDAMTSNRSYRNAIPQNVVREEMVKGSGTQFDPEFAAIMVELIDEDTEYTMKE
ncbi:MAG: HD-GYP domain-containing protein [Lachnospiraceae bacterium]|nr:HD-GYP domain-containing protein [Lachnospiraceae bacterium]